MKTNREGEHGITKCDTIEIPVGEGLVPPRFLLYAGDHKGLPYGIENVLLTALRFFWLRYIGC